MKLFVIKEIRRPREEDVEKQIEWLCDSFGFWNRRDHDRTATKVFEAFVDAAQRRRLLSSDDVAHKLKISRGTAVHHIKKYVRSGLVVKGDDGYELRMQSVEETLGEMEHDMLRTIRVIRRIAKEIDEEMGLAER